MSLVESLLDFSDVEDTAGTSIDQVDGLLHDALNRIERLLCHAEVGERLRDGLTVVIAGPPNVGKSSLMNALARRDVSIVSPTPGTTRDLIEISMDVGGFPVVVVDSAGIRETTDPVEAVGVARARSRCESADLTLWLTSCVDAAPAEPPPGSALRVKSKWDLAPEILVPADEIAVSARSGRGLDLLMRRIRGFAEGHFSGAETSLIGTERQRVAVQEASRAIRRVLSDREAPIEVVAEELRIAERAMSRVVGRIDVEELLGDIFSRLCVGK